MCFIVHNTGFLPSFSKKSFCGLSVKNQDILNNSETSPQVLILLCASTCRSTTKSCPEDLQQSLRLTESQSPYPRPSQNASKMPWMHFNLVMLFQENSAYFLPGKHGVLHLLDAGQHQSARRGKALSQHPRRQEGSCSQSVHCSSAHLHGPLGVQHSVTPPCSLCNPQQKRANTSKTRNISSDAIFCFHLDSGADQLTTQSPPAIQLV